MRLIDRGFNSGATQRWVVIVEAGEVASIGFIAPFKTRQLARNYIAWHKDYPSWNEYIEKRLNET